MRVKPLNALCTTQKRRGITTGVDRVHQHILGVRRVTSSNGDRAAFEKQRDEAQKRTSAEITK